MRTIKQKDNRVEDIPNNQLKGKIVNTKLSSNSGQEPIDTRKQKNIYQLARCDKKWYSHHN